MIKSLRDWMEEGPFTLALSSAFFGFYAHAGFAAALFETGARPAKYTGSSAGALVAAGLASGLEPTQVRDLVFEVRQKDFWDPGLGFGYLRGRKLRDYVQKYFAPTFAETKTPLEISVFDLLSLRTHYLNEGPVAPAVAASCAVPLMFHPVRLGGRFYADGGIRNKSGIHPSENERVLCVYLESAGAAGVYERKTSFPSLRPQHKIMRFTEFPRVSYQSLHRGPEAYKNIFERSAKAFTVPFGGNFLDV